MFERKNSYLCLRFITLTLLVIGGLAWGILGATGTNPISRVARSLGMPYLSRVIYSMVGIASLIFIFNFYNRNTFLPFLGPTVLPPSVINLESPIDYDQEVKLSAPAGAKYVVFWAAQSSDQVDEGAPVKVAYGDFSNAGAQMVENDGTVILRVKSPVSYVVRQEKRLKSHIHYRWLSDQGMLSKVHTLYV